MYATAIVLGTGARAVNNMDRFLHLETYILVNLSA